jgi:hypothetical protein
MRRPRNPKPQGATISNDNARKRRLSERPSERFPEVEVRVPREMPLQLVEVEVLAELLDSLPPPGNDDQG